jgi:hypothetical protein
VVGSRAGRSLLLFRPHGPDQPLQRQIERSKERDAADDGDKSRGTHASRPFLVNAGDYAMSCPSGPTFFARSRLSSRSAV